VELSNFDGNIKYLCNFVENDKTYIEEVGSTCPDVVEMIVLGLLRRVVLIQISQKYISDNVLELFDLLDGNHFMVTKTTDGFRLVPRYFIPIYNTIIHE